MDAGLAVAALLALAFAATNGLHDASNAVAIRRLAHRATRRWRGPVRGGEWGMSAALAFSHGANDRQKSVGVIAATRRTTSAVSPPVPP
jgi:PiT family inorganic phosphate transporter